MVENTGRAHLELGCVEEVCRANGRAADVPLRTAADNSHLLLLHDVEELRTNLARLTQTFHLQEMVVAPIATVSVGFPLLIHVQKRQVVALWDEELFARRITLLGTVRRPAFPSVARVKESTGPKAQPRYNLQKQQHGGS